MAQTCRYNAATRCVLRAYNAAKCECSRDSAPYPTVEAYSAPQNPLADFKGAALQWGGRKGKEGMDREGREGMEREVGTGPPIG